MVSSRLDKLPQTRCLFWSILLCWLPVLSLAEPRTVTVDDTNGDEISKAKPTYQPDNGWGQNCQVCIALPNASLAFDGTWHDTTHSPHFADQRIIIVRFGGTAVSVFFITPTTRTQPSITNLTFAIDGELVGNFVHEPAPDDDYKYNVLGYSNSSLENFFHDLVVSTTGDASLVLFDYLTYTYDTADMPVNTFTSPTLPALSKPTGSSQPAASSPSPSRTLATGAIIGIVLAGFVAFVSALILFLCRRRRRLQRDGSRWKVDESILSGITATSPQGMSTSQAKQHYSGGNPKKDVLNSSEYAKLR